MSPKEKITGNGPKEIRFPDGGKKGIRKRVREEGKDIRPAVFSIAHEFTVVSVRPHPN